MGAMAVPSVKARTLTSGPVKNSSMTTRLPESPKARSSMMVLTAALRLFIGPGDQHPLAQGQAVRLDDDGEGGGPQESQGLRRGGEHLIPGGGDVVFLHQVLGKDLAGLDPGGLGVRAEAGDARGVEGVHAPQGQGVVRRHHGEVHGVAPGEGHDAADVRGPDLRHADGVGGDAAVARQGVNGFHSRILFQLFDDGVLPAAAAHYEERHVITAFLSMRN